LVVRDGDVVSVHSKDGKYAGKRLYLDKDSNPTVVIEDAQKSAVYRDVKTNKVISTWVRDGDSGYFIQPNL